MIYKYAYGHNQSANAVVFPYEPKLVSPVEFDVVFDSTGVAQPVGGAEAQLLYDYLEYEEMQTLLYFLGINTRVPSRTCTIVLPDLFRIPIFYNGVITLDLPRTGRGWFDEVRLNLSALEVIS